MSLTQQVPFGASGDDVTVWPQAKIVNAGAITVGDSVIIDDFALIIAGDPIDIGSFVHIASFVSIVGGSSLIIEDFVGLSGGVRVYTGNDDYLGGCLTGPTVPSPWRIARRAPVRVEKHAIVGANSVVLPGVTIGAGAAVGANSLVNRNLDPWTVYGGTPVRAIRERPRERMLQLEQDLRRTLYDTAGRYIPRRLRRDGP